MATRSHLPKNLLAGLSMEKRHTSSHLLETTITINHVVTSLIRRQVIEIYRRYRKPAGLENVEVPASFFEQNKSSNIDETLKRFALRYIVFDHLINELRHQKIHSSHHPRLTHSRFSKDGGLSFTFTVSIIERFPVINWKLFPFKSPRRKLYKDLDKQVETFLDREQELFLQHKDHVTNDDWVEFEASILDPTEAPILSDLSSKYWLRFSTRYVSDPFREKFAGKRAGDTFVAAKLPLVDGLSEALSEHGKFKVKILSVSKGRHFSVDLFKSTFKLKTKSDIHKKLIEVFSFRNDISQRKSIVEEVFNLFLSQHRFEIPKHLVLRKQEDLIKSIRRLPDYHVYKAHKRFDKHVGTLAEKQLKEEAIMDTIAYHEGINIDSNDIRGYLHLFNHSRLREFVYFKPALEHFDELDVPLPENTIKQAVLREKTLNHIISVITQT
ncbi:hypothetical protein HOD08_05465 [bacterium]|nr:hypothetical protein [bacterium]